MDRRILGCEYNWDNGYVEVFFTDGNMLILKCEEVEKELEISMYGRAELQKLLDEKPLEYVELALEGKLQEYCDEVVNGVESSLGRIVEQYVQLGYSRKQAEMLAREVWRE